MSSITVKPLGDGIGFGSRVSGVTQDALQDQAVRRQLTDLFWDRGLIVFEDVEPTSRMHVAISNVFGPLKDHPVAEVPRADQETMPGVIDMRCEPNKAGIVSIEGKQLAQWLPWHFDHCYNNELNRAGVLRALEIPPEGGMTGFADCIALYDAVSPEIRHKIEGRNIVYTLDLAYCNMRFGKPRSFHEIVPHPGHVKMTDLARTLPRAIHPAVFTRETGEKVLHISPWMAVGIEGQENPAGDALLAAACEEILDKVQPYFHRWKPTDMLIWDNWRVLHSVSGHDPKYPRRMQRTTIKGDYGLGYFENQGVGHKVLEMTV
jgi:taurine dioxygenase